MRWYVHRDGETVGPVDEEEVAKWVSAGMTEARFVPEGEQKWRSLADTPFAAHVPKPPPPPRSGIAGLLRIPDGCALILTALAVFAGIALVMIVWSSFKGDDKSEASKDAAAAVSPPGPSPEEVAAPYIATVNERWAAFDALPKAKKTKAEAERIMSELDQWWAQIPSNIAQPVAVHGLKVARQHVAFYVPGASATGDDSADFVPGANPRQCIVQGLMSVGDLGTLQTLLSLGYRRIVCPNKTWVIADEIAVCYVWSADTDRPGARNNAPVWSDLKHFRTAQRLAEKISNGTDDLALLGYMSLVSEGATEVAVGTRATIVQTGQGWFRVVGEGFAGYVEPSFCHHTARK